jgi:spoIIIJ-associated protein
LFLDGLADAFGVEGDAEVDIVDDDQIEVRLVGDGLGLLIGPKGQTLAAVQDLTRAAVQRGPRRGSRLRVDVGGYQERRRGALVRFAQQMAEQVQDTGVAVSLEPMPAFDRKVVHDTVNTLAGVSSRSEGEDPRRQVLILPADLAD